MTELSEDRWGLPLIYRANELLGEGKRREALKLLDQAHRLGAGPFAEMVSQARETLRYNPEQVRAPKGTPIGGRWINTPEGVRKLLESQSADLEYDGNYYDNDAYAELYSLSEEHQAAWDNCSSDEDDDGNRYSLDRATVYNNTWDPKCKKMAAISRYVSDGYPEVQAEYRSGEPLSPMTQTLTEAFSDPTLTVDPGETAGEPVAFYRGSAHVTVGGSDPRRLEVGDVLTEPGLTSMTYSKEVADNFGAHSVETVIVVPPGFRVLPGYQGEREAVLPPGTKFVVIGVETSDWNWKTGGHSRVFLEVVE